MPESLGYLDTLPVNVDRKLFPDVPVSEPRSLVALNKDWSSDDIKRQALYYGLLGLDWNQTKRVADPKSKYRESNPIITHFTGPHPSKGQINNIIGGTALGHTLLMNYLSPEWRKRLQELSILGEGVTVYRNPF